MTDTQAGDDYYVEVLSAADDWYDLILREDEPSDVEWDAVHDRLGSAVEALLEYEALAGKSIRDEPWGGQRTLTFAVIDAAIGWYQLEDDSDQIDLVHDRLGDAVGALQEA